MTFGLALVLCMCAFILPASAEETAVNYGVATDSTAVFKPQPDNDNNSGKQEPGGSSGYLGSTSTFDDILGIDSYPAVTTDDVDQWVARKGGDIISIVTKGAQVVAVIGFFGALFLIIIGALGNKRTMAAGFVALIISILVYTAVTCAPQIITATRGWLIS